MIGLQTFYKLSNQFSIFCRCSRRGMACKSTCRSMGQGEGSAEELGFMCSSNPQTSATFSWDYKERPFDNFCFRIPLLQSLGVRKSSPLFIQTPKVEG